MRKSVFRTLVSAIIIGYVCFMLAVPVFAAGTITRDGTNAIIEYSDVGIEIETQGFENNFNVTSGEEKTKPFYEKLVLGEQDEPIGYYNYIYVEAEMTARRGDTITVRLYTSAPKEYWRWTSIYPEECEDYRCEVMVDHSYYNPDKKMMIPYSYETDHAAEYLEYTFSVPENIDQVELSLFADYEAQLHVKIYIGDYAESNGYSLPSGFSSGGSSSGGSYSPGGSNSSSGSSSSGGGSRIIGTIVKTIGGIGVTFVVVKMGNGIIKLFKKGSNQDDVKRVRKEREAEETARRKAEQEERAKQLEWEQQRIKDAQWTHQQAQKVSQRDTEFDRSLDKAESKYKEGLKQLDKQARLNKLGQKYGIYDDPDGLRKALMKDLEQNQYTSKLLIEQANRYDTAVSVAEGIVTVADFSVSALSNISGPMGPVVNDLYAVGKNFGSRLSEARYGNGEYGSKFWQAAVESVVDLAQNHASITEGSLSSMAKDLGFNVVSNVGGEGLKAGLNSYVEGKDWLEIAYDTASGMGQGAFNSVMDVGGSVGNTLTNDAIKSNQRALYDKGRRALEVGKRNGLSNKSYGKQMEVLARKLINGVEKGTNTSDVAWDITKNIAKKTSNALREKANDAIKKKLF